MTGTILYGPQHVGTESVAIPLCDSIYDLTGVAQCDDVSWMDFKEFVAEGTSPVTGVLNYHLLYELCVNYICDEENCEHPSDMGAGKAGLWRKIKEEFKSVIYELFDNCEDVYIVTNMKTDKVSHTFHTGDVFSPKLDWISEDFLPSLCQRTLAYLPIYRTNKEGKRKEDKIMICSLRPDVYAGDATGELPKQIKSGDILKTLKGA